MVADAKAKKTIEPEEEPFWQWKVTNFQYTDQGITQSGAQGDYVTKKTWLRALSILEKGALEHAAFTSALSDLEQAYPAVSGMREHLGKFAREMLRICFYN